MEQDKTGKLKEEMDRLGFAPLVREMYRELQGKEQIFLAYRDPGNIQKKMPMQCIIDIRLHGMKKEYYIHNYVATITKESNDRLSHKYITRSKTFYSGKDELPNIGQARQLLQQDISRKQEQKQVKRKQKQYKKGLR